MFPLEKLKVYHPADVAFARLALSEVTVLHPVRSVKSGEEAIHCRDHRCSQPSGSAPSLSTRSAHVFDQTIFQRGPNQFFQWPAGTASGMHKGMAIPGFRPQRFPRFLSSTVGTIRMRMVGATGFEPATSCSQSKCSSQAELRSEPRGANIHHKPALAQ